jgi:hypothetical protein
MFTMISRPKLEFPTKAITLFIEKQFFSYTCENSAGVCNLSCLLYDFYSIHFSVKVSVAELVVSWFAQP